MNNRIIRTLLLVCISVLIILTIMAIPNYLYATDKKILGDINNDNKIDSIDLLYMMRHIVAENGVNHKEWFLRDDKYKLADVTQNGKVNSSDMLVVLRYIAANNNPEEIGKKHKDWLVLKKSEIREPGEENNEIEINNTIEVVNEIVETNNIEIDNNLIERPKAEVRAIKLNKALIDIEKGKTEQIIAAIEPKELSNEKIEWKILNTEIAEVDEKGKITGKKNGETIVTARTSNGKEATSKVRVGTYPKAIVINKEEVKIDLSEKRTEKVEVRIEPEDASNKEIKIDNSNERVATIDGEGKITAKENGETELTFKTANGIEKKLKVKVETSATGVKLDKNYVQLDLSKNKQSTIKATIEPSTASNKEVTYTSSNERVATVDKNGKITAKGNGETNITARTSNGKEAVCKVEVQTVATKINMDKNASIDLSKEKEKKITVEVEPDDAKNKSVMIRSSNEEVATIDSNGTIKAKKNGEATITAQIAGTDIVETCKVTVITSPTGLKLSKTNVSLDMSGTKSTKITAEVEPSTASNKNIKWTNENSDIVYVSSTGEEATLTGLKNGEATITAIIEGTDISKECKVVVTTSPKSIKINKTSATLDMSGTKTVQLTTTVEPSTAQDKTITWSSSNTSIAAVDKNGKVTAKKNGTTTITAKTVNNKTATSKITVTTNPTGIKLNKTSLTIDYGKTAVITATISPSTSTNKTVSWSSNNTSVATVDKNGKVTGKSNGTATITAKTSNGKTEKCKVTVKKQDQLDFSYKGNGKVKAQFSSETMKIVEKHLYDFNANTFYKVINSYGGFNKYAKSLGGIFGEYYGKKITGRTEYDFQMASEYVLGWMYMYGWDYLNDAGTHARWVGPDAFYINGGLMRKRDTPNFDTLISGQHGVNMMASECGCLEIFVYNKLGITRNVQKQKPTRLKDLKVGDCIYFFDHRVNKSSEAEWGIGRHNAIVGEVYSNKIVIYDAGSYYPNHKNYKRTIWLPKTYSEEADYAAVKKTFGYDRMGHKKMV